ncbi:SLBB domain-containing protein, partial [Dysgonomonas sp. UBA7698]
MKRVILYFFISLISGNLLFAQMSDSQVIEYVKTEAAKGTSQQMIATELLKRGATQDQLLRIKSQVNQQNQNTSNINTPTSRPTLRKDVTSETYALRNDSIARLLEYQREYGFLEDNKPVIFGKNIFNQKNLSFLPNMNIPTPEDYKLGPGDEIVIDIWGASQASLQQTISPEGSIVVDRLGPVYLNGMTIREANSYIQQKFSSVYSGIGNEGGSSQIKLTLGQIRTIQINILGEVAVPGTYALSSLSSVFHALYNAGGINDIGSLRSIQLYRKGKLIKTIDIYQYLLNGNASGETRLMDGDIIMVPPYISLVEIVGKIKRPMFYEMTVTETLSDLIKYSGGFTGDAYKEKIDITRKTGKYDKAYTVSSKDFENFILDDKDSIFVSAGLNQFDNRVEIKGAVFRPGYYEVGEQIKTIKNLIEKAGGIKENAFLNRAILTRE